MNNLPERPNSVEQSSEENSLPSLFTWQGLRDQSQKAYGGMKSSLGSLPLADASQSLQNVVERGGKLVGAFSSPDNSSSSESPPPSTYMRLQKMMSTKIDDLSQTKQYIFMDKYFNLAHLQGRLQGVCNNEKDQKTTELRSGLQGQQKLGFIQFYGGFQSKLGLTVDLNHPWLKTTREYFNYDKEETEC